MRNLLLLTLSTLFFVSCMNGLEEMGVNINYGESRDSILLVPRSAYFDNYGNYGVYPEMKMLEVPIKPVPVDQWPEWLQPMYKSISIGYGYVLRAEIDGEIWYNTTDLSCSRADGYFYKDNKTSYTSGDDDSSLRKVLNWEDWICIFLCNEYGWAKVIRKSGE